MWMDHFHSHWWKTFHSGLPFESSNFTEGGIDKLCLKISK